MSKSHAADWAPDAPKPAQLKEFFAQIESRRITRGRLQAFLRGTTEPKPPQAEIEAMLDMHPLDFFSEKRFWSAGVTSRALITRSRNGISVLCKENWSTRAEHGAIDIVKMWNFLLTYNRRKYFGRVPNVGDACIEAIECVIRGANLPFNWGTWNY